MPRRLKRFRGVEGGAILRDGSPPLRTSEGVLYLPYSDDRVWGLLAEGEQLGAQAALHVPSGMPLPPLPDLIEEVSGDFIYVGLMHAFYGHFVCDVLSMLWPLEGRSSPPPKIVCHTCIPRSQWNDSPMVAAIMARLGYSMADLVTFDSPVRLERVLVGETAFRHGEQAFTVFGDLTRRIGASIIGGQKIDTVDRPVYLSKAQLPSGFNRMVNEADLDEELIRRGVDVVYPERLSFDEQVRLIAERRTIMGSVGSALHTTIFGPPGRRIIGITFWDKVHGHFALIDQLNQNVAKYYTVVGVKSASDTGFELAWRVPHPAALAQELVERALQFDALDARDARDEMAATAPLTRSLDAIRKLAGRLSFR